jgi:hypothetical protein
MCEQCVCVCVCVWSPNRRCKPTQWVNPPGTFHSNFPRTHNNTAHTQHTTHNTHTHTQTHILHTTDRTAKHTRSYCVTYRAGSLLPDSALVDWEERCYRTTDCALKGVILFS